MGDGSAFEQPVRASQTSPVAEYLKDRRDEVATRRDPTPFELPPKLEFHGVVGHASAEDPSVFKNRAPHANSVRLAIVGTDAGAFAISGPSAFWIGGTAMGDTSAPLSVRFVPMKAGPAEAVLLVNHEYGQQFVRLVGHALQGDGKTTPTAPGSAPAVAPLETMPASERPSTAKDRVQTAARHLAELGDRYNAIAPAGQAAAAQLKAKGISAGAHVNSRLTTWLRDEGLDDLDKFTSSSLSIAEGVKSAISFVLKKTIHAAELEGAWYAKVAEFVVDKALEHVVKSNEKHETREKSDDGRDHVMLVADQVGKTGDAVTSYLLARLDAVASGFAEANSTLKDIASKGVPELLKRISDDVADVAAGNTALGDRDYDAAGALLGRFSTAEASWSQALQRVGQFGASMGGDLDAAVSSMLDAYILARHDRVSEAGREEAEKLSERVPFGMSSRIRIPAPDQALALAVGGNLRLDEKLPVQLDRLTIDGIGHVGATIQQHVAHKRLSQLEEYDVRISLLHPQHGRLVLKQKERVRSAEMNEALAAEVNRAGGIERIWAALDAMELGDRGNKL